MLLLSNLAWPDQPYGAGQRPFGEHRRLLAAFALAWADIPSCAERLPVSACVVYLHVPRTGALPVVEGSFEFGFHAATIHRPGDVAELVTFVDRELERSNRHGTILAGHELADDLAGIRLLVDQPIPGVVTVDDAWRCRDKKRRGLARLFDTGWDVNRAVRGQLPAACAHYRIEVDLPTTIELAEWNSRHYYRSDAVCGELITAAMLRQALTIGLVAGAALEQRAWNGVARVNQLVSLGAWDRFDHVDPGIPVPV